MYLVFLDSQNQKKLQTEVKSAEKADDEYKKAVDKLKTMESRFYDTEMPQILKVQRGLLFVLLGASLTSELCGA